VLNLYHAMNAHRGVEVWRHALYLALDVGEWLAASRASPSTALETAHAPID